MCDDLLDESSVPRERCREVSPPASVAANMRSWGDDIAQLLPLMATGHLRDINDGSSGMVFITGTPYYWSALPSEANAHQARALAEYRRFADTLGVLTGEMPDDRLDPEAPE